MANDSNDPIWQAAWAWVQREHERTLAGDSSPPPDELLAWLAADPRHRPAYDKAGRLWLLSGLLPPATRCSNDEA